MSIDFVTDDKVPHGQCQQVSPLVRRVTCKNPGPFTYTGTGSFIIGNGTVAILDPGPNNDAHLHALLDALAPGEVVSHIICTHTHSDHSPLAAKLKALTHGLVCGAVRKPMPSMPHDASQMQMEEDVEDDFTPDINLTHGDVLTGADWTLETIATPGHISNHLCFGLEEEKTLFTGDHIMGWATSVVIPPDGNMNDYMASLKLCLERDDEILRPTHGPEVRCPKPFIQSYINHRKMRETQIMNELEKGLTNIKEIVAVLYTDIDPRLHPAAAMFVWAHLQDLVNQKRVSCDNQPALDSVYSPV